MKSISIQGIRGAFHEEAARIYFQGELQIVEHYTFEELVTAVSNGDSDVGIMAIENTISGTIHRNLDLIKQNDLRITGEIYHRIEQNLAVSRGVKIKDLIKVQSHYMAINQCRKYFRKYPHIKLEDIQDTALGMKNISESNSTDVGAIGSKLAADYYDLDIIASGIETDKKNYTRFLILEKELSGSVQVDKATINFVLGHERGALARVLNLLNKYEINLTKIESLPIVGEPWHYEFYIDMSFDSKKKYDEMIPALMAEVDSLVVLGLYPKWEMH